MSDRTLRKTIYLNATPETVWDYLTDPDKVETWFHRPAKTLTEGVDLDMCGKSGDSIIRGTVRAARPPEYLEYSFIVKPMGDMESLVKWHLEAVEGGTMLSLEHSGLPVGAEAFGLTLGLDKGWDEHFGKLRAVVAT